MIAISAQVDGMISADPVDVKTLTAVFFFLYFLMATQDIAVDGWALTMLSEKNVGYASTANSVGQTFGYFGAYIIFMALNSASFCNNYLRSIPEDAGLIELSDFLWFWGWVFVVVTLVVWWLKAERKDTDTQQSVWATYKQMLQIITRKNVLNLSFMLLTTKIALAGPESIATLKLVEGGVPKEHLAFMGALLAPFGIFIPILIGKYTSGPRPLSVFMHGYLPRVAIIGITALIVWQTPVIEDGEVPYGFYAICFGFSLIGTFASNLMFVSQMALFARVSDPAIGGTYMTLLNTVANLGTKWPQTVSMFLVDPLTIKDCVDVAVTTVEGGESVTEECVTVVDGYYIICATCTVIGVIWYTYFNNRVQALERKELHTWRLQ
jgi:PAT family acetyl-CoA transporter-like MFS transporter 1